MNDVDKLDGWMAWINWMDVKWMDGSMQYLAAQTTTEAYNI